jgi:hypothetical protein
LPDQIAALEMVRTDRTLPGVVGKAAFPRADVERFDGPAAQRPEAHRGNVQNRRVIGLLAGLGANQNARIHFIGDSGRHRVVDPLVAFRVHVALGAERKRIARTLGSLVDDVPVLARKGLSVGVRLDEVLLDLGPNLFE